jgi:hypothetical protein
MDFKEKGEESKQKRKKKLDLSFLYQEEKLFVNYFKAEILKN